jgi:hypothetical protein
MKKFSIKYGFVLFLTHEQYVVSELVDINYSFWYEYVDVSHLTESIIFDFFF